MDRRTAKETAGLTTNYIYDGDHAAVEYDNSGALVRKFIYGPGIDDPLVMVRRGDAPGVEIKYYYHADVLGSIAGLTNSTGAWQETYSYSVWGKLNGTSSVGNPYFYTGRRYDAETGLYYYRARYYDAYQRRFIQPDPIGFDGGMNWYAYVGNSPVNYVDPYGEASQLISFIVEAGFLMYDTYDLYQTLTDSCATQFDKKVATALYALGAAAPLGAYNTVYKKGKKFLNRASKRTGRGNLSHADDFDKAREEAFENAGLIDPDSVKFSKYDPATGTVVEFKGEKGAKVSYDAPHADMNPAKGHDKPHVGWQSGGKQPTGGHRGNITYDGPQHPSRPNKK